MSSRRTIGTTGQMLLLGLIAGGLSAGARWMYESPLPLDYAWASHVADSAAKSGMQTVTADEARAIADSFSHVVLDARKATDYQSGHIPGALSLPVSDFDRHFAEISVMLAPEQPILVYCSGAECEESLELAGILMRSGYTNITLFAGGITEWQKAGHPVAQ